MNTFRDSMRSKDFVVTADLPLTPATTPDQIRSSIEALRTVVDAIQIPDNRDVDAHIDPIAVASIAISLGVDPVLHLSCRDRNRIALQSSLLGAAALGVSSLMLVRGQKLPESRRRGVKGVFDTGPPQLIELARRAGERLDWLPAPGFYTGTYAAVVRPNPDWQAAKLLARIEAGARFVQTLPCLNVAMLKTYVERLVALKVLHRTAVVVEVPLLSSAREGRDIKEGRPGSRVPEKIIQDMEAADDPAGRGFHHALETLKAVREIPGVTGVNIVHGASAEAVARLIRQAGIG